jgi:hypothetical protein
MGNRLRTMPGARRRLRRAAVIAAVIGTMGSGVASAQVPGAGQPGAPQTVRVEGIFGAAHGDPADGRGESHLLAFVTPDGAPSRTVPLALSDDLARRYGGLDALMHKQVAVTGVMERTSGRGGIDFLRPTAIDVGRDATRGPSLELAGYPLGKSLPALTIMCAFADKTASPFDQSFLNAMVGADSYLDHYWRDASYHQVNLLGSQVVPARGWYKLPGNEVDYLLDPPNLKELVAAPVKKTLLLTKSATDCTALAAQHVNLDDFAVINLVFNTDIVSYAFGGGTIGRRLTWLPAFAAVQAGITAHEMGHAWKMAHAGLKNEYDSAWDVMSGGWKTPQCQPLPMFTCAPTHPSAFNKNRAGWLENRRVDVPLNATTTLELQPVANPGPGPVMAKITPDDKHFYTVEFRNHNGRDAALPFDGEDGAVIIHEQWVSGQNDEGKDINTIKLMGTNGTKGARWLEGSEFERSDMGPPLPAPMSFDFDGVTIEVDEITPTSATVTIRHFPAIIVNP